MENSTLKWGAISLAAVGVWYLLKKQNALGDSTEFTERELMYMNRADDLIGMVQNGKMDKETYALGVEAFRELYESDDDLNKMMRALREYNNADSATERKQIGKKVIRYYNELSMMGED